MLRFLARFFAVVLALAFVACTVPLLFIHAAGIRLAQPEIYENALVEERIYDRFPALFADATASAARLNRQIEGANGEAERNFFRQLSPADWEAVFGALLPPGFLRQQTERALTQFFGWVHSDRAVPAVTIELGEFKQRLVAPETEEAYVRILQSKPPCTATELQSAGVLPIGCCPPPGEMPRVRQNFRTMVQFAAGMVPRNADLFRLLSRGRTNAGATRNLAEVRTRLLQLEKLAWWSLAAPAALLLLMAVLAVRSFRSWMFWWGIPCLTAGAAGAVLALSAVPVSGWMIAHILASRLPAGPPAAALGALAGLMTAIIRSVMEAALGPAGVLAIAGLAAVILGVVLKPRPAPADRRTQP